MFVQLDQLPQPDLITLYINDNAFKVAQGISVAAALLQNGMKTNRHTLVSGSPRGSYCMMGVCFECLVEINQQANKQACMTIVAADMRIKYQTRVRHILPPDKQASLAYDAIRKEQEDAN